MSFPKIVACLVRRFHFTVSPCEKRNENLSEQSRPVEHKISLPITTNVRSQLSQRSKTHVLRGPVDIEIRCVEDKHQRGSVEHEYQILLQQACSVLNKMTENVFSCCITLEYKQKARTEGGGIVARGCPLCAHLSPALWCACRLVQDQSSTLLFRKKRSTSGLTLLSTVPAELRRAHQNRISATLALVYFCSQILGYTVANRIKRNVLAQSTQDAGRDAQCNASKWDLLM